MKNLSSLDLKFFDSRLNTSFFQEFSVFLAQNPNLKKLQLSLSDISATTADIENLAIALKNAANLRSLELFIQIPNLKSSDAAMYQSLIESIDHFDQKLLIKIAATEYRSLTRRKKPARIESSSDSETVQNRF